MDMNQKNQYIEEYIKDIAMQMNKKYNANLMDDDVEQLLLMFLKCL